MPTDLYTALRRIEAEDGQLKEAGEKLGHEPEQGHMDGAGLESPLGQALGRGPMDAKAILDEKGLREAGRDLEGRTWQDPREAAGARNLGNKPGMGGVMPTQQGRHLTRPTNVSITGAPASHRPDSLAGGKKTAGEKVAINMGKVPSKGAQRFATHAANKSGAVGAVARKVEVAKKGLKGLFGGKISRTAKYDHPVNKARQAAAKGGDHIKKHRALYAAGAGAAAGVAAGKAHSRKKSASLAEYMQAYYAGEAGIKLAHQAYDEASVLARDIQRREFVSVGCGLAEGMLVSKLAEQNRS